MQRTPHRCPHCEQPLLISNDMWGPYYLCEDCGWTAEDDSELVVKPAPLNIPPHLLDSRDPYALTGGRRAPPP